MDNGSISLGRISGIPLLAHWSVVLVAVLFGTSLAAGYGALGAVVATAAFLGSIVAHEVAHALVARRHGVATQSIQLWALGGVARLDREAPTPRAEGWIAAAGPLTSLVIGGAALTGAVSLSAAGVDGVAVGVLGWLGVVNLILAVFNLLPGAPLDGGRILKAVRWHLHGDRHRAGREAANAGRAVGWSLAGVGIVMVLNDIPGIMLVVSGLFVAVTAKAELAAVAVAERLQGIRVGDLTWFGIAHATDDTDADTMLWQRRRLGGAGVVAVDQPDGHLAGLVREEDLWAVADAQRPWTPLARLVIPIHRTARADPDEQLSDVLSRLDPRTPIITVWREGKLLGVVPRRRLMARLTGTPGR